MTLRERAEQYIRDLDTAIADLQQKIAGHTQESYRLTTIVQNHINERDSWMLALKQDQVSNLRKVRKKSSGTIPPE